MSKGDGKIGIGVTFAEIMGDVAFKVTDKLTNDTEFMNKIQHLTTEEQQAIIIDEVAATMDITGYLILHPEDKNLEPKELKERAVQNRGKVVVAKLKNSG